MWIGGLCGRAGVRICNSFQFESYPKTRWWLNHPLEKILRKSTLDHFPKKSGVKKQKKQKNTTVFCIPKSMNQEPPSNPPVEEDSTSIFACLITPKALWPQVSWSQGRSTPCIGDGNNPTRNRKSFIMGPYKPLRTWVDEFIPYYMEIMGV